MQKKIWSYKIVRSIKILCPKKFGSKNCYVLKKFWSDIIFENTCPKKNGPVPTGHDLCKLDLTCFKLSGPVLSWPVCLSLLLCNVYALKPSCWIRHPLRFYMNYTFSSVFCITNFKFNCKQVGGIICIQIAIIINKRNLERTDSIRLANLWIKILA